MNKRAFFILLLLAAVPAQAHHSREHVLGAPPGPVIAASPPATPSGANFWLALGPFFALTGLGAIRWGHRHRCERRVNETRAKP